MASTSTALVPGKAGAGGGKAAGSKRKWARTQCGLDKNKVYQRAENHGEYNIWYGKYLDWDKDMGPRPHADTRCNVARDAGGTRADNLKDGSGNQHICMHFARGACSKGRKCTFLHRLPRVEDERKIGLTFDCFGRSKFGDDKEDMGGIGSFNKDCRTLYIGNIGHIHGAVRKKREDLSADAKAQEILARHFGEWGLIDMLSYKPKHNCAFVTYRSRLYAEFAKVAMADQSLDGEEQLNIRWAYDDPNPKAIQRKKEESELTLLWELEKRGFSLRQAEMKYHTPDDYTHVPKEGEDTSHWHADYDMYGYHTVTGDYKEQYDRALHAHKAATSFTEAQRAPIPQVERTQEERDARAAEVAAKELAAVPNDGFMAHAQRQAVLARSKMELRRLQREEGSACSIAAAKMALEEAEAAMARADEEAEAAAAAAVSKAKLGGEDDMASAVVAASGAVTADPNDWYGSQVALAYSQTTPAGEAGDANGGGANAYGYTQSYHDYRYYNSAYAAMYAQQQYQAQTPEEYQEQVRQYEAWQQAQGQAGQAGQGAQQAYAGYGEYYPGEAAAAPVVPPGLPTHDGIGPIGPMTPEALEQMKVMEAAQKQQAAEAAKMDAFSALLDKIDGGAK